VRFYRTLFGVDPAKHLPDYAKFELDRPPLVLALYPSPQQPGGALNHIGLRMPDSAALVEVQHRLEAAGVATQRREGSESCSARQPSLGAPAPDRVLGEIPTLEAALAPPGFDAPPLPDEPAPDSVWEHRLTDPWPDSVPYADGSLDEVRLEGTFNA